LAGVGQAVDNGRVGTDERRPRVAFVGRDGNQLAGRQAEIVRAEADRSILHLLESFGRHLKLDLRLTAEPAHLIPHIQGDNLPALLLQLPLA
jgi:hypothetical protein